ncbi:hypothetical protein CBM2615_A380149 [Cupriavidus taiwanensis]|uniref:Uncharacterized protein n=1 Tax=Cupriavidus taiwanensis TaxID=164546 RepID=A0A375E3P6_9BURK|nr:hypothetical protein CBM2615_A380149 [Cupriavidus taiwanensis]SOZ59650.1 hypothetical protein CBM2614_A350151 [Cupriavidus taiwanensis]SOZ62754.1 hypothetical protein CBM2613_A330180 [Cupriavidus taiwanensis]SPA06337.1 hypothetical protein CBM2625_A280177 [Cupriavidus taiwanensis]
MARFAFGTPPAGIHPNVLRCGVWHNRPQTVPDLPAPETKKPAPVPVRASSPIKRERRGALS